MKEIRTEFVENNEREERIKHWESTLSNATHAVYIAQQQLDRLYRQRYIEVERELGATAIRIVE